MSPATYTRKYFEEILAYDGIEDANLPGSLPTLRKQNIDFHKDDNEELPARIHRIWYINPYGQEIQPSPNPRVLLSLNASRAIIYSIGSLYTSIVPCLVLKGVGDAIADPSIKAKILILNGSIDRETGPSDTPFTASDFVCAIANACGRSSGMKRVTDENLRDYVTHIIHLEGDGTPAVDREDLKRKGIETVKVYGPKNEKGGMLYDGKALGQALEAILGGAQAMMRRNTLHNS